MPSVFWGLLYHEVISLAGWLPID